MTHGIIARIGQGKTKLGAFLGQEAMGDLHEHAAAVTSLGIGADGAAMVEIEQDLETHLHHVMGLAAFHIGNKPHTAGIFFQGRIIKTHGFGQARITQGLHGRRRVKTRFFS